MYTVGELEGALVALRKSVPEYPQAARRQRVEGWIKIQFVVDEQGRVGQIEVLAAQPQGMFEPSVRRCVVGWRFKAGTIDGRPVKALVHQTIYFRLD